MVRLGFSGLYKAFACIRILLLSVFFLSIPFPRLLTMRFFSIVILSALALLAGDFVKAAPSPTDCSPNFQGSGFAIQNYLTNKRWSLGVSPGQGDTIIAASQGVTAFRAESTGGWPSTQYIIK